jgi:hypothetical protein
MPDNKSEKPEFRLLNSIMDEELKGEKDEKLKEIVRTKAGALYSLIFLIETKDLDESEVRKKIKSLIEEG